MAQTVKCLFVMQETWVRPLGWEDPLEKEMAAHSSILAWKIPWTSEPGRLPSMGLQRVGRDWATSLSLSLYFTKQTIKNSPPPPNCHALFRYCHTLAIVILAVSTSSYIVSHWPSLFCLLYFPCHQNCIAEVISDFCVAKSNGHILVLISLPSPVRGIQLSCSHPPSQTLLISSDSSES